MGDFYSNYTHNHKQPPKSGFGFLQAVIEGVVSRAGPLVELLEAPHRYGGNPGHPAAAMLAACVMQFALNKRYANAFLKDLGSNERLLGICGMPWAPSESAYSQFKKKLTVHQDLLRYIIADLFLECGVEIERLRAMGLVPADKPPLGHSLVIDSTDVEAWARPGRKSHKTGEDIPSKDPNAKWGHRTAKNVRSSKPRSGKRSRSKAAKGKGDGNSTESGQKESKDELYFGYKVDVLTDANHGLPMFAETRPANASDVTVMIQDLDDCLALYRTLSPRYFLGDKGYDSLKNILHIISLGMMPVVAVRRPEKDKETGKRLHDGIFDEAGRPTCIGGQSMEYVETDPEKGHLFRCPADGCYLKETVQFTRHCDAKHYEKPEGRLLATALLRGMEGRVQEAADHRAVLQQRQAQSVAGHASVPEHLQGVAARRDVDAGLPGDRAGTPPGRRLRPHEAHENQVAGGEGCEPKQAAVADAGLPGPRLRLLCPVARSGVGMHRLGVGMADPYAGDRL